MVHPRCVCTCVSVPLCLCLSVCACMCVSVLVSVCACMCVSVLVSLCVHICAFVCASPPMCMWLKPLLVPVLKGLPTFLHACRPRCMANFGKHACSLAASCTS